MGAGDTIGGEVRVVGEFANGDQPVLIKFTSDRIDYVNNTVGPAEKLYLNTAVVDRVSKPGDAESKTEPRLRFEPGETLKVQHKSASLEEAIDHDFADVASIDVLEWDYNRGGWSLGTLDASNQGLAADPTSSTSEWVTFYEFTVPDRTRINIAGVFGAVAVEAA